MTPDRTIIANQALALHQQGLLPQAIELYERAFEGAAKPAPLVQYYAGMAYLAAGKPRKAVDLLGKAAEKLNKADAHLGHGNALYALKWYGRAVTALQQAVALDPYNATIWFNLGNAAQAAHDDSAAINAFRTALDNDPLLIRALPNLMAVLVRAEKFDDIALLIRQMHSLGMWRASFYEVTLIAIPAAANDGNDGAIMAMLKDLHRDNPEDGPVLCLLGNLYLMQKEFSLAEDCYVTAADFPDQQGAGRAACVLLAARGDATQARNYLEDAVESDADGEQILKLCNLMMQLAPEKAKAVALFDIVREAYPDNDALYEAHGSWLSALCEWKSLARILEVRIKTHDTADTLSNLGAAYMNLRQETAALKHLWHAVKLDPKQYSAWYNLSSVLSQQGKNVEAFEAGMKAFKLGRQHIAAASQLAMIAGKINQNAECERILKKGLKYNPASTELLNLLGNCKLKRGDMKGALDCFDQAREHAADNGAEFGMQLMAVNYSAKVPPQIVADMHFKWGDARIAGTKQCEIEAPSAMKAKLKIAFMSGDYKNHSCSFFLGPLLANLDPARLEVYCYMTEDFSDEVTLQFRKKANHWRDISRTTDEEAAKLIQKDGIDILIELSGHTSGARLGIMASKPAPIQVTWLGYPNTTGLSTIDYRFTDALADPPGLTDKYYREKLYRLPNFLCYQPPEFTPDVAPLPAAKTGQITFGCFNNSNKITDEVVAVWAQIMKRVPGSKMVLKTSNLSDQLALSAFRKKFEKNGIEPERVECFESFRNKSDHLMTYGDIDLALDPFPYNGTTTTFESLWMGVPMVTYAGEIHASRVGHAIMTAAGLGEFVAESIPAYVDLAVSIASDIGRLAEIRATTRAKLQDSPLMNGKNFAKSMEESFFDMWQHAVTQTNASRKAS